MAVLRLMDSITQVPHATEQLDFLIRRLEKMVREPENFKLLNVT